MSKKKSIRGKSQSSSQLNNQFIGNLISLYEQRRFEEILSLTDKWAVLTNKNGLFWNIRGAALTALDRDDLAIAAKSIAVRLLPHDHAAHSNLSNSYLKVGDWAKAESFARKALSLFT